jgi:hypothetical protein
VRLFSSTALAIVLAALGLLMGASQASAIVPLSIGIDISCSPTGGVPSVTSLSIPLSDLNNEVLTNGMATWMLPNAITFKDSEGNDLGLITNLTVQLDRDPLVSLGFAVQNLSSSSAHFSFTSSVQTVSLLNPQGYATAGITLTDTNLNGGSLTGTYPGAKAYRAFYNGNTDFANLVSSFTVPATDSTTNSERGPVSGMTTISGTVTSIASSFDFDLSPQDLASGTSTFYLTPEPATLSLLALGGLAVLRRRARR